MKQEILQKYQDYRAWCGICGYKPGNACALSLYMNFKRVGVFKEGQYASI